MIEPPQIVRDALAKMAYHDLQLRMVVEQTGTHQASAWIAVSSAKPRASRRDKGGFVSLAAARQRIARCR